MVGFDPIFGDWVIANLSSSLVFFEDALIRSTSRRRITSKTATS